MIDENYKVVNWYTEDTLKVPNGNDLVLISYRHEPNAFTVDDVSVNIASSSEVALILPSGSELIWDNSKSSNNLDYIFSGYLVDEE